MQNLIAIKSMQGLGEEKERKETRERIKDIKILFRTKNSHIKYRYRLPYEKAAAAVFWIIPNNCLIKHSLVAMRPSPGNTVLQQIMVIATDKLTLIQYSPFPIFISWSMVKEFPSSSRY